MLTVLFLKISALRTARKSGAEPQKTAGSLPERKTVRFFRSKTVYHFSAAGGTVHDLPFTGIQVDIAGTGIPQYGCQRAMGTAVFRNGVQVSFCATMCNALPERRMRFNCSEGTIVLELYDRSIKYRRIGDEATHVIRYGADFHGGGDSHIMKELWTTMTEGVKPKCSGNEGLESAVFALGFDQSAREGKIIDLEPVWKKLNR